MAQRKVALVTGGNKGIGFSIVKLLSQRFDGIIYLTARNAELGEKAVAELNNDKSFVRKAEIAYYQLDVCSDSSVQALKKFIETKHKGLDILINNAGMEDFFCTGNKFVYEVTKKCMETNVFGLIRVCDALFPLLRPHARVVHLGSMVGMLRFFPAGEPKRKLADSKITEQGVVDVVNDFLTEAATKNQMKAGYPPFGYYLSKAAVHALASIQQKELDKRNQDIIVNAVSPGYVATDLNNSTGGLTTEQGATPVVHIALLPEHSQLKGEFVDITNAEKPIDWRHGTTPELEARADRITALNSMEL